MKKALLFVAFIFNIACSLAQVIVNRSYHDRSERPNPFLIEIYGDLYFTTQGFSSSDFGKCFLYKHNGNGVLKFKSAMLDMRTAYCAFKTNDNKVFITGQHSVCDVMGPEEINFVAKIDTNGSAVFTSTYSAHPWDHPVAALQYSDSSYFSFTDSLMVKHSKTGAFQSKMNLGLKNISGALLLPNNNILLSAKQNNVKSLVILQSSGSIISSVSFPALITKFSFYSGQKIMGLGDDGNLYKLSPVNGFISSSSFAGVVNDFVCKNDSVYCSLGSVNSLSQYMIVDTAFVTLNSSTTTTNKFIQRAICLTPSKVAILAAVLSRTWTSTIYEQQEFGSFTIMNKTGSNNFSSDLTLVSVQADSSFLSSYTQTLSTPTITIWTANLRPMVKVKNSGSSIIHSFNLNCLVPQPFIICGYAFYQQPFSGLSLMPGDSITLSASAFVPNYLGTVVQPSLTINYCFYTTLPNGETDKTLEDNELCKSFNYLITSLKDQKAQLSRIDVFPNPFEDMITIESVETIKKIEMSDALGRIVKESTVEAVQTKINTSDLPAGIYFVKINGESGNSLKKVIKQ